MASMPSVGNIALTKQGAAARTATLANACHQVKQFSEATKRLLAKLP